MISKNKFRIINCLYFCGKAHVRKIAKTLSMHPITASRALIDLEKQKIVYSSKEANLKHYLLNYSNSETIGLLCWIENRRLNEMGQKTLTSSLIKELKNANIEFCIFYGSVIRGALTDKSDIDIFFVSGRDNLLAICRKIGILVGRDISPHIVSINEFKKLIGEKEAFAANTILKPQNRIFLFGVDKFFKIYV